MKRLLFIALLTLAAAYVVWPQQPGNYIPGGDALPGSQGVHIGSFNRQGAKLGLDLQGGSQLTLQADMSQIPADQRDNALKGVLNVIERRVNAYGVAEPQIQTRGNDRVIVQLPGLRDPEEAKKLIGQTAKLEFKEQAAPACPKSRSSSTATARNCSVRSRRGWCRSRSGFSSTARRSQRQSCRQC